MKKASITDVKPHRTVKLTEPMIREAASLRWSKPCEAGISAAVKHFRGKTISTEPADNIELADMGYGLRFYLTLIARHLGFPEPDGDIDTQHTPDGKCYLSWEEQAPAFDMIAAQLLAGVADYLLTKRGK